MTEPYDVVMNQHAIGNDEINRRFDLHSPDKTTGETMSYVRADFKQLASELAIQLPDCRETSLAFTKLEEALFHAISALARDGK